jgi:RimJ/RimL family protein N-acetyltransferase
MLLPELVTSRLKLRAWKESDFEPHVLWEADYRVNEFLPVIGDHVARTPEASRLRIARFLETPEEQRQQWARDWLNQELNRPNPWWAVEVPGVADVIGGIGIGPHEFEFDFGPCIEIGWRFAPRYWGQGYATEAAKAVLAYGFDTLGFADVYSMSALGNKRSFAVMKRIGLRYVKDYLAPGLPDGHPLRPYALYRITRSEWSAELPG